MKIEATTVEEYILKVPEERRPYFQKLVDTVVENTPDGFELGLSYGMIGLVVPLSTYPDGYHCNPKQALPFVSMASQKNFVALYHSGIYADPDLYDWFVEEYPKHNKRKLDMGKSCVRFKKTEEIPFELIAELMQKITVEDWISTYEARIKK